MTLGELLGLAVRTESGARLGRVRDVRAELSSRSLRITGLVVGSLGALERLGLGAPNERLRVRSKDTVAWADVVHVDRRGVVVRDEAGKRE